MSTGGPPAPDTGASAPERPPEQRQWQPARRRLGIPGASPAPAAAEEVPLPPARHTAGLLAKSSICEHHARGFCPYGDRCRDAHSPKELGPLFDWTRATVSFRACTRRDCCTHTHSLLELRTARGAPAARPPHGDAPPAPPRRAPPAAEPRRGAAARGGRAGPPRWARPESPLPGRPLPGPAPLEEGGAGARADVVMWAREAIYQAARQAAGDALREALPSLSGPERQQALEVTEQALRRAMFCHPGGQEPVAVPQEAASATPRTGTPPCAAAA